MSRSVLDARVVYARERFGVALSSVKVAREVNSTARAGEVGTRVLVITVDTALKEFADLGCKLLDDQVLKAASRSSKMRRRIAIKVS